MVIILSRFAVFLCLFLAGCKAHKQLLKPAYEDILWTASWSSNGKYIAAGGNHKELMVFSGEDYRLINSLPIEHTITKVKWHPTETFLAIATQPADGVLNIYDFSSNQFIPLDNFSYIGGRGIGWNHDGSYLAVSDNEGMLYIFNKEREMIRRLEADPKGITGLSWKPKENIVVTVGSQIGIYHVDTDSLIGIKPRAEEVLMLCVEWHPSGEFFVTGDYGDYELKYPPLLQFWSAKGEKLKEIEESKAEYRNLKWSSDGETLATASEALRLWTREGILIETSPSDYLLWGIDWSKDGQMMVTTNEAGEILIWNNELSVLKKLN